MGWGRLKQREKEREREREREKERAREREREREREGGRRLEMTSGYEYRQLLPSIVHVW